ncbi:hypothetical protein AURDEDRAFT_146290 [Auricularia subglabra TFB-10046 SS5]|uniref:F-box domain-containing protein n=1 Tax=Auricularia subglabra (strain TFB-10046 / SS5) TaxID=717982 RepID=J0WYC4_AURST|nr:hypothetical protein AURDEDRAFT_146290 [Auricularia subglabra TFB-10046 SS5]
MMARRDVRDRRRHGIVCTHPILRELRSLGLPELSRLLPAPGADRDAGDAARPRAHAPAGSLLMIGPGGSPPPAGAKCSALPEEVVLQIFSLAADPESPRSVFQLSGVCRLWRDYAINYPPLWANIRIGTGYSLGNIGLTLGLPAQVQERMRHRSLYMLQLQLERSRHCLLNIRVRCLLWSDHVQALASTLAIHQSRWRNLSLESESKFDLNAFFGSCRGPTNQLESLSVSAGSFIEPKPFSGTLLAQGLFPCPALQTVTFTHCLPFFARDEVAWDFGRASMSRPFPNVTRLEVTSPPIEAQGDHWRRLLSALPHLEEFHLSVSDILPRLHTPGFMTFPSVRSFSLDASPRALQMLQIFSFPRLKALALNIPLLQLHRSSRRGRRSMYGFLETNRTPHLIIKWPQNICAGDETNTIRAFEEICGAVFSSSGVEHLTVELQGTRGPWVQLLRYMDGLTADIAGSLGAPDLRRLEIVFKSPHPWADTPWVPVDDLARVSEEFRAWETVLQGEGPEELFALWVAVEEPSRRFTEVSLAKWMMA